MHFLVGCLDDDCLCTCIIVDVIRINFYEHIDSFSGRLKMHYMCTSNR